MDRMRYSRSSSLSICNEGNNTQHYEEQINSLQHNSKSDKENQHPTSHAYRQRVEQGKNAVGRFCVSDNLSQVQILIAILDVSSILKSYPSNVFVHKQ
ncbi:7429_t:CDS:2 [Dentiscutata erythropus]|uniref:7429_t:CDS:1 n=1 Tax=Dentiscutata erythropus TaxID=1348616 RepID=A0A9N9AZS6_9GLOM|nr:7429_t:CDS:2 [Dentiscutata erythropus]